MGESINNRRLILDAKRNKNGYFFIIFNFKANAFKSLHMDYKMKLNMNNQVKFKKNHKFFMSHFLKSKLINMMLKD